MKITLNSEVLSFSYDEGAAFLTHLADTGRSPDSVEFDAEEMAHVAKVLFSNVTLESAETQVSLLVSDLKMARVAEDVLDALKSKGVLSDSDLPEAARDTVSTRKNLRQ